MIPTGKKEDLSLNHWETFSRRIRVIMWLLRIRFFCSTSGGLKKKFSRDLLKGPEVVTTGVGRLTCKVVGVFSCVGVRAEEMLKGGLSLFSVFLTSKPDRKRFTCYISHAG